MRSLDLNQFLMDFNQVWREYIDKSGGFAGKLEMVRLKTTLFSCQGIFASMAQDMGVRVFKRSGRYGFDAMLVSDRRISVDKMEYPLEVKAVIKQLGGLYDMQAVWETVHWRSPLKVVVIYDSEHFNDVCDTGENRVEACLSRIFSIIDAVDDFNVESQMTEYLFLVLRHDKMNTDYPVWYWSSNYQRTLRLLTGAGALDLAKTIAEKEGRYGEEQRQIFKYSFAMRQPFEEVVSLHGALHRRINRIVDSINQECKAAGLLVDNVCVSIEND